MANVVPFSFAQELLKGTHNFTSQEDTIKFHYTANPYTQLQTLHIVSGTANQVEVLVQDIQLVETH